MAYAGWESDRAAFGPPPPPPDPNSTPALLKAVLDALTSINDFIRRTATGGRVETLIFATVADDDFTPGPGNLGEIKLSGRASAITVLNTGANDLYFRIPYQGWTSTGVVQSGQSVDYDFSQTLDTDRPVSVGLQAASGTTTSCRLFVQY